MDDEDRIIGRKRAEIMEQVLKAVSSFSHALKTVSYILKFHAISLSEWHVAR